MIGTSIGNRYIVTMNAVQCKMARAALGLGVRELAKLAEVSVDTISRLERGEELMPRTITAIRTALEAAGITFLDGNYSGSGGPGVRLTQSTGTSVDVSQSQTVQHEEYRTNDAPPGAGG